MIVHDARLHDPFAHGIGMAWAAHRAAWSVSEAAYYRRVTEEGTLTLDGAERPPAKTKRIRATLLGCGRWHADLLRRSEESVEPALPSVRIPHAPRRGSGLWSGPLSKHMPRSRRLGRGSGRSGVTIGLRDGDRSHRLLCEGIDR
jgi:hypothetical protein